MMDLATLFGLGGKRALVTGGTSGIGLSVTEALASGGASVLSTSDRETDCAAAAKALKAKGRAIETLCLRLSGKESAKRLADGREPNARVKSRCGTSIPFSFRAIIAWSKRDAGRA
jgi:NAD(P)-dependent dehydrogenase (short-subunit alcohol dehydrogenase family)